MKFYAIVRSLHGEEEEVGLKKFLFNRGLERVGIIGAEVLGGRKREKEEVFVLDLR